MDDIIQVLPDSVANQIAAGEVIQRPASVVKELVENAVDAGATEIKVVLKDAGKTSIQVVDNGSGMSDTDARLAFERHSTSKIKNADDLFSIHTMGFRGEALASIAAISHVDLKTRQSEDEIGTHIRIEGTKVVSQEPVQCPVGCNFIIKNLFYNVPARRKFLKKDSTELNHTIKEFQRVALAHPGIEFSLYHNDNVLYRLPEANFGKRIVSVFGEGMRENLIPLETNTGIVKINGYIGHPQKAKKRMGEQFFFVNNRYMKSPYLHKAVMDCYDNLIQPGNVPAYFIYLEITPESIDINIHPTKTEVKFEDQQAIWQILNASVRESLGKNNIVPSLDFDQRGNWGIPTPSRNKDIKAPTIEVDPTFNPFEQSGSQSRDTRHKTKRSEKNDIPGWEKLYDHFEDQEEQTTMKFQSEAGEENVDAPSASEESRFFQFKQQYILTPVKSGLMIIDQKKCHTRILYESFLNIRKNSKNIIQKRLYPEFIQLNTADYNLLEENLSNIAKAGFEIKLKEDRVVEIYGVPADIEISDVKDLIEGFLEEYQNLKDVDSTHQEQVALGLAKAASINYGRTLAYEEMRELVDKLFACTAPNYTPDGEKIISLITTEEIEKLF
jgi:DNA mismatch repair protein MutL